MLLIVKDYARGGRSAYETSDDGGTLVREIEGPPRPGERIGAYVEAACDNNEKGLDRLLESVTWLVEELKKRKGTTDGQG
jgi:hypothetical protein